MVLVNARKTLPTSRGAHREMEALVKRLRKGPGHGRRVNSIPAGAGHCAVHYRRLCPATEQRGSAGEPLVREFETTATRCAMSNKIANGE